MGIGFGGSISNAAPSTVNGNVVQFSSGQISGPGTVTGTITAAPAHMDQAYLDAVAASGASAGLTPTQTFASSPSLINGMSGLNVIQINSSIANSNLTLNGSPDAFFVINVTGGMAINGSTAIGALTGGVTADHVLWNFESSGRSSEPR